MTQSKKNTPATPEHPVDPAVLAHRVDLVTQATHQKRLERAKVIRLAVLTLLNEFDASTGSGVREMPALDIQTTLKHPSKLHQILDGMRFDGLLRSVRYGHAQYWRVRRKESVLSRRSLKG